ncbi:S8 family serine peptidase [Actinophytocola sp.]|uniref:S8 family peptidase n=1 Tax=Actinophytocola sp. TaxID=1872138 RepID=UPI002ED62D5A
MSQRRARAVRAGLLVVATASTAVFTGGPTAAAPAAPPATNPPEPTRTVTLLTGDVVTLGGPNGVDVAAAKGREHIAFRTQTDVDGDVYVFPDDTLTGVWSGQLDKRLFDVTDLAGAGFGDRKELPLIVDYPGATPRIAGASAVRELPSVSAVAVNAGRDGTFWATARTSAKKIWLDGKVKASLDHSVPQIGAPEAWAAGHTGAGATVAVLDTGIDVTHPDLDDAVTGSQDFTGNPNGADDGHGHGTHLASTITGSGDRYKGVAPDAHLLNGKVMTDFGDGHESWIIAGMEWAATNGADVVNLSLGTTAPSDGADPMSEAVNRLTAETGVLFVVAAGNSGYQSIGSPAAADAALTVGAVDRDDQLATFSSTGPRFNDGAIKPDITAPGVDIVAARAANGWNGTPVGDGYVSMSGTSMATPHVAGAAAILAGAHPDWTADRLKSALMSSADPTDGLTAYEQGAGRVDVPAALGATVSASPVSLGLGTALFPHNDDQPIAKTVTYTNQGTAPVTLGVTVDVTGPDGKPAPAGMFTVSAAQVTVPAGGSTDVTVTADTRVDGADGEYSGAVVATGAGAGVRTPIAVTREIEKIDVKLTFLDHDGQPTPHFGFRLVDRTNRKDYFAGYDPAGQVAVRVPKGTYFLDGTVWTRASATLSTQFNEPAFVVDGNHTAYTFDARDGVPLGFTVDRPEATEATASVSYQMKTKWGQVGTSWSAMNFRNAFARPSRTTAPGAFDVTMTGQLARPDGTGTEPGFHASPYLYNVRHVDDSGAVPADMTPTIRDRDLAKVVSSYAVAKPGKIGLREKFLTMPLPYTLIEYYTPGSEWSPTFDEITSWDPVVTVGTHGTASRPRSYELGPTVHERWNTGVFGPGFAYNPTSKGSGFSRQGDHLQVNTDLIDDQNADLSWFDDDLSGTIQVVHDGEVVAESPYSNFFFATLPPEEATYTARATTTRTGPLSTRVDAEWTFRSSHTDEMRRETVPALAVRFAPNLDSHNAAKAGTTFRFPVYVQRNGAEQPGQVNKPTVEISYDDGTTWQPVRVTGNGQWQAEVKHPRNATFASLRWSVSDNAGNSAKATIIHAYALKK